MTEYSVNLPRFENLSKYKAVIDIARQICAFDYKSPYLFVRN